MPVLNPDHLLDQADRLVLQAGGGAPRQADLRRAISGAYYAVFHAVLTEAADLFIGRNRRGTTRYRLLYRSIDHKSLRTLSEDIVKKTLPAKYAPYVPKGGFGPDIHAVASAITDLQEKRHLADYDPLFRASTSDAVLVISTGRSALARFRAANRALRSDFVSLAVFAPR